MMSDQPPRRPGDVSPDQWVERFLDHVEHDRSSDAAEMVLERTRAGWSVTDVVRDLLVPAKFEVGRRWQEGDYSVAQEHVASGAVEDSLGLLVLHTRASQVEHTVAFACAEGEWHTTPARMAMLLIRDTGWRVRFLGGALPADLLARSLDQSRPEALAVSCTLAANLLGVLPMVQSAHERGVPVLVGGRAFDAAGARAARLGADAYLEFAWDAESVLQGWVDASHTELATPSIRAEHHASRDRLTARHQELTDELHSRISAFMPDDGGGYRVGREDVVSGLRYLEAAVLLDDPTVFHDFVGWLANLVQGRGVPAGALVGALVMLEELLGDDPPEAATIVADVRGGLQLTASA